jgi:hypothetical protein
MNVTTVAMESCLKALDPEGFVATAPPTSEMNSRRFIDGHAPMISGQA